MIQACYSSTLLKRLRQDDHVFEVHLEYGAKFWLRVGVGGGSLPQALTGSGDVAHHKPKPTIIHHKYPHLVENVSPAMGCSDSPFSQAGYLIGRPNHNVPSLIYQKTISQRACLALASEGEWEPFSRLALFPHVMTHEHHSHSRGRKYHRMDQPPRIVVYASNWA